MINLRAKYCLFAVSGMLLILLLLGPGRAVAQDFADPDFYLVDSLNLSELNDNDRHILDSCLQVFHDASNDTIKVTAIEAFMERCSSNEVWPKYNQWLYEFVSNKVAEPQADMFYEKSLGLTLNNLGYYQIKKGNVEQGLHYYHQSLEINKKLGVKDGVAAVLNNIASIYKKQGDISRAIDFYHQSMQMYEELEHKKGVSVTLNNIGHLRLKQGDPERAIEYFRKSLELNQELGGKSSIALNLNNLGLAYKHLDSLDLALQYYQESLQLREEIKYEKGVATSLAVIGDLLFIQEKYDAAFANYERALQLNQKLDNKLGIAINLNNTAKIHIQRGNLAKAKANADEALQLGQELGYPYVIGASCKHMADIAEQRGDWKSAFQMYRRYVAMQDSIKDEEHVSKAIQKEADYQYQKQKAIDSLANAEAERMYLANIEIEKNKAEKRLVQVEAQKKQNIYLYIGLALVALFGVFMFNRFRITNRQKQVIDEQKQIVEAQRDEAAHQKNKIEQQHSELKVTHQEISDSIRYAERLQRAIFPLQADMDKHLGSTFVLFQPKDVVSGDFYWMYDAGSAVFFAAADCTGHGVPGAMVSVVCSNALNRSVKEFGLTQPKDILNKTRELVIETFASSGQDVRDGMDIALCKFSKGDDGKQKVTFSGANSPLWVARRSALITEEQQDQRGTIVYDDTALIEFRPNKQPIGLYENMRDFEEQTIDLYAGDQLYLFSDGFADQFGGPKGKKFKYKPLKELLLNTRNLTIDQQGERIRLAFAQWKGEYEQIDDVCVIGLRV